MSDRLTLVAVDEGSLLDVEVLNKLVEETDYHEQEYHDMVDDTTFCGRDFTGPHK